MSMTRIASQRTVVGLFVLLTLSSSVLAQQPATQPASRASAPDPQRLEDLVALIDGHNLPLAARQTGARELLRQDWPEAVDRLRAILAGDNTAARIAVALALADVPESRADAYIDPLLALLASADSDVRHAAAAALACYRDSRVVPSLREIMLDESKPLALRLAAIEALGMMSQRAAVAALVEALRDPSAPICHPALQALEQATAMSFGESATRAQAWWERSRALPPLDWQQEQTERLVRTVREVERRLHSLEARLVESFREEYIRAAETERGGLLQGYLKDDSALVRLLGLELVHRQLGEGKELPAETAGQICDQVRALLTDSEAPVRAAAVQAVARFRETADADRFMELLASERHVEARRALVNGLGYIGTATVVPTLLAMLQHTDDPCRTEAVAALGRLAERGVLDEEARGNVADVLLTVFGRTEPSQATLRERTLWAMSQVGDSRFGETFIQALADVEAAAVRQAAIRGIAALKAPQLVDTLIPLTRDADTAVRKTAIEAFADVGSTDDHLAALWERLDPAQEVEESARQAAWRGAVRLLASRPMSEAELEEWIARLPDNGAEQVVHTLELLEMREESLAKVPDALPELGRTRMRIATQREALGQTDRAITAYLAALRDLHAAQSADAPAVALQLLRLALVNRRYDEALAFELANGNPPLDGTMLWEGVKGDIEQHLTPSRADRAIAMLEALQSYPPTAFSPEVAEAIEALLARARTLKSPRPTTAPATRSRS